MPITKYRCADCGKEFAKILLKTEDAPSKCPVCGATELEDFGAAFDPDARLIERLSCFSCDSCGEQSGCAAAEGNS
ncbi:MAG: zinc ribbon domain-containing protein [Desulfomonilaceae bacterium]|nr:zinc ribbon domain-containing protein [Desulfomonilaceae bacterium]